MKIILFLAVICWYQQCISAFGYTSPKGYIYVEEGNTLRIYCTIDLKLTGGKNSSFITFTKGNDPVSQSYVHILNETSVELVIPNMKAGTYRYSSYLNRNGISINSVYVGYKPSKVINFKCRSQNWQNLNCSFERTYNPVVPGYNLTYYVGVVDTMIYNCTLKGTDSRYWCMIDGKSDTVFYRPSIDFYHFKLFSYNEFGNFTENFTINNFNSVIPAAPEDLEVLVKSITPHSASIKWSKPFALTNFSKNLTHYIEYKSEYDDAWKSYPLVQDDNHNHTIQLQYLKYAYTTYTVRIRTKVSDAEELEEMWSDYATISFITDSKIPDTPPEVDAGGFRIDNNGDIRIYWKQLTQDMNNGPNLHYKIVAYNSRQKLSVPNTTKDTMIKYNNNNTDYNDKLEFWIYSVNAIGSSINFSKIIIPARRYSPPSFVKKLRFDQNNATQYLYKISWTVPPKIDLITSYTVFWCRGKAEISDQCDGSINFMRVNSDINDWTYPSNQTLNFAVSANFEHSSSGLVWAMCTVLPNTGISKVSDYKSEVKASFIVISWRLECPDETLAKGHKLTYCAVDDELYNCKENTTKSINISADARLFNITGLLPYTTYKADLLVYSDRDGPLSSVQTTTLQTIPSEPQNLRYETITNTSVILYWTRPEYSGPKFYYEVWYNEKFNKIEQYEFKNYTNVRNNKTEMEYTLFPLSSYTLYNILILACNSAGCSNKSNSIEIKTLIGVPGPLEQATYIDDGTKIRWKAPKDMNGPLHYYEFTVRRTIDGREENRTVLINGTECTLINTCDPGIRKLEYFVSAVNIIHSPHAKPIPRPSMDTIRTQSSFIPRNLNGSFQMMNASSSQSDNVICVEQNDPNLRNFIESDKYPNILSGKPSTSLIWICKNGSGFDSSGQYVIIAVGLFGMAAITYVSYFVMRKIRKMKDISVELPAGLEDIGNEGKSKHLDCTMNKTDITRSDESLCPQEQQQHLLGRTKRSESASSNITENNSVCEFNPAMDDSESEHPNDDDSSANTLSENIINDKASPIPLLTDSTPTMLSSTIPPSSSIQKVSPILSSPFVTAPPIFSNSYVPNSLFSRPAATSNGYTPHEAIIRKPPVSSGYISFDAISPKSSDSMDNFKSKVPIVTSTDAHGISGYVTQKQLSDYGQSMQ